MMVMRGQAATSRALAAGDGEAGGGGRRTGVKLARAWPAKRR